MTWLWETFKKVAVPKSPDTKPTELFHGPLEERPPYKEPKGFHKLRRKEHGGPLCKIDPPEKHQFRSFKLFTPERRNVFILLQQDPREYVPVKDIEPIAQAKFKYGSIGHHCTVLWLNGYLEKWVAGEFGMANVPWKARRQSDRGGKYHGVHYKVIKDFLHEYQVQENQKGHHHGQE